MKIEVICKKKSFIIIINFPILFYVIISSFLFVSSRKIEKFFKIVCCSPSEHIFLRNDFDSAFYQGWFVLYTHVNYMHIYYIHRRHSILRAEDASHRDARNQLRLSCFLSVSSFLSFSCPLSSFSLFLFLSLSNAEDIWKPVFENNIS